MAKKKSSAQCSAAGKALAECRWGSKKKKAGKIYGFTLAGQIVCHKLT